MTDKLTLLEGTVTWANEKGVVLDNEKKADGKYVYRNFTTIQEIRDKAPSWDAVGVGDRVKLGLDGKGWVCAVWRVSAASQNGAAPLQSGNRDDHIARSVALKAAVDWHLRPRTGSVVVTGPPTDADVVLTAEFFLTFLQPSEPAINDWRADTEIPPEPEVEYFD